MSKFSLTGLFASKRDIPLYKPRRKAKPANMIQVDTAWAGLEQIIEDILKRFKIKRERCIEFGAEFGYSSAVFSNYFNEVTGVDTFEGDEHTGHKGDHFEQTKSRLSAFQNIQLYKSDYRDWIKNDNSCYDFAHVDIVHNYKETYECGLWAVNHSTCTIFHDTESFPAVRKAVIDIAKTKGKKIYNYPKCHGLGIIV
jgi:predicted O-methyltransferase YrrM